MFCRTPGIEQIKQEALQFCLKMPSCFILNLRNGFHRRWLMELLLRKTTPSVLAHLLHTLHLWCQAQELASPEEQDQRGQCFITDSAMDSQYGTHPLKFYQGHRRAEENSSIRKGQSRHLPETINEKYEDHDTYFFVVEENWGNMKFREMRRKKW